MRLTRQYRALQAKPGNFSFDLNIMESHWNVLSMKVTLFLFLFF